jgi:hypothetical protein
VNPGLSVPPATPPASTLPAAERVALALRVKRQGRTRHLSLPGRPDKCGRMRWPLGLDAGSLPAGTYPRAAGVRETNESLLRSVIGSTGAGGRARASDSATLIL